MGQTAPDKENSSESRKTALEGMEKQQSKLGGSAPPRFLLERPPKNSAGINGTAHGNVPRPGQPAGPPGPGQHGLKDHIEQNRRMVCKRSKGHGPRPNRRYHAPTDTTGDTTPGNTEADYKIGNTKPKRKNLKQEPG